MNYMAKKKQAALWQWIGLERATNPSEAARAYGLLLATADVTLIGDIHCQVAKKDRSEKYDYIVHLTRAGGAIGVTCDRVTVRKRAEKLGANEKALATMIAAYGKSVVAKLESLNPNKE